MQNRKKHSSPLITRLLFFALIVFAVSPAIAQSSALRVTLQVTQGSLPITIGVPFSEPADIRTIAQLTLLDPNGNAIPLQARVLARWRGKTDDETKPIKWALLDFTPKVAGQFTLTDATSAAPAITPLSITQVADKISVASSRLKIEFGRNGANLINNFKMDNIEQFAAPLSVQGLFPHSAMVVAQPTGTDALIVNDPTLLTPGTKVQFEHTATLKWTVEKTWSSIWSSDYLLQGNRRYLLDEGTPQQEEVFVTEASYGTLKLSAPLQLTHNAGAKLRDLTMEQETATIKSTVGQTLTFTAPLKQQHTINDCLRVISLAPLTATASVEKAVVEEANALRVVIKQQGHFSIPTAALNETASTTSKIAAPTLNFTLRYYIYADQPFVRVRLRLLNEGTYGFGAQRLRQGPYAQHVLLRGISVTIPTVEKGSSNIQMTESAMAYAKTAALQSTSKMSAGNFEIAVPEFAENYPKALLANKDGLRFDVLPDTGNDYLFDGARAKTTDFYLGRETNAALVITNSLRVSIDPAYVARTGAVRPLLVEKRDWTKQFTNDPEMAEAAQRAEKHFAVGYAVEESDSNWRNPAQSIFEYRLRNEMGANLGWRNFGDLAWGDGYCNTHYDLPFVLLREFLRTGDTRAFQRGSEMARYRADWGQYHANDYWDSGGEYNMRGLAFYEKGDHGSDNLPLLTHNWIEGMWLHWALTGDEIAYESANEASEALARFISRDFTFDNALKWNESRWLGWPALGLVVAWRYTGDTNYLASARKAVYGLVQAEEKAGRKGWFIPETSGIGQITQPFMWAGYCQFGIIEYWRETGDNRVANYMIRVADWLLGKTGSQAVLQGGKKMSDGRYQPIGADLNWAPNRAPESAVNELAMLNLPLLSTAARITHRADLRTMARQLFRDVTFYRDINDGGVVDPNWRAPINFRAFQFGASASKVYGHTGLGLAEFIPDLIGAVVEPRRAVMTENSLLQEASIQTVQIGQSLQISLRKTDASGAAYSFTATNLPANAIFQNGEFRFTPMSAQAGKVLQVTFTGTNVNGSLISKLDIVVLADAQAPQIKLLTPTAGARLMTQQTTIISWAAETTADITKYEVRLSTDGGASYPMLLAELPASANQYAWQMPETLSKERRAAVRILIVAIDKQNRSGLAFTEQDLQIAGQVAVVSAANYSPAIAPGSLCAAFGSKLATPTPELVEASTLFQRNGTIAEITDSLGYYHRVPLLFADRVAGGAYDQVNFYLPEEIAVGQATITITAATGETSQGYITVQALAPAAFTKEQTGQGEASVVSTSDSINFDLGFAKQDPTKNVYVSIFGTGWRFASTAQGGKSLPQFGVTNYLQAPISLVTVELNGQPVEVLYAGAQPDYLGLDQINIQLPRNLQPGVYPMIIKAGDQISTKVLLRVQ